MLALAVALALAATPAAAPGGTSAREPALPTMVATFHHDLTTPTGPPALTWANLSIDRERSEMFVVGEGFVRVFDASGMEVHRFGDDGSLGDVMRAAALEDGEIVVLSTLDGKRVVLRCDFRGELLARMPLKGLPENLAGFEPDLMVYRNGRLYFAERGHMRVVVTDTEGAFEKAFDLARTVAAFLPEDSDPKPPAFMDGFGVDPSGNLLFTSSTMFAGGVVSPTGEVRIFGGRGSRPGRFNIIGGIDADENGFLYVTDRLRSVVTVWDPQLHNLGEFGYRGDGPSNLLSPFDVVAGNGKVFVSQAKNRGVKVFRVKFVEPQPAATPEPTPPRREPPRRVPGQGLAAARAGEDRMSRPAREGEER